MFPRARFCALSLGVLSVVSAAALAPKVAATPPMGWNSWDAYGLTIDEKRLPRQHGGPGRVSSSTGGSTPSSTKAGIWRIPSPAQLPRTNIVWDANGLLIPVPNRFPSAANGAGFKPLADWVHAQGLKFGIHIVRGIPRGVVDQNLPIAGTSFHAADAADKDSPCPWDEGNWGVKDNEAGQAYYDSMMQALCRVGPGLHQGGLHLRSPVSADRDSADRRGNPQDGSADPAQSFARTHATGACG